MKRKPVIIQYSRKVSSFIGLIANCYLNHENNIGTSLTPSIGDHCDTELCLSVTNNHDKLKWANLSKQIYLWGKLQCITTTNHNWSRKNLLCIVLYCLPDRRIGGGGGGNSSSTGWSSAEAKSAVNPAKLIKAKEKYSAKKASWSLVRKHFGFFFLFELAELADKNSINAMPAILSDRAELH